MKDKPLGFQIWILITIFVTAVSIVVSVATIILINHISGVSIKIYDLEFLGNLVKLILCIVIVSIIIAKIISNTITRPISMLEKKVRLISNKNWNKSIKIDRRDEIGKLAFSINKMQEDLERLDKEEEFFLQSLSHELKTPIMVIKNYCSALLDEIYINDSKEETILVIDKEADILGEKINKLLYLNALEYVLEKDKNIEAVRVEEFLKRLVDKFCTPYSKNLVIELESENLVINCIAEKIQVALQNIIENSLRYANSYIKIKAVKILENEKEYLNVEIKNDGASIPDDIREHLFDKFYKGQNGKFGLGLFITRKIIEFHEGSIAVENFSEGVIFVVKLPVDNKTNLKGMMK